jgi:gas vesicle protein
MLGVIIGAITGVLAAMALTPFSGAEAREKARVRTADMRQRATDVAATAKQRAEPMREKAAVVASAAKEKVEPVRERAMDLAAKSPLPINRSGPNDIAQTDDVAQALEVASAQPVTANDVVTE